MTPIEVNKAAPAVAEAEAFVGAPIDTVWQVLSDFESWPNWNKGIRAVHVWKFETKDKGTHVHTEESFEGGIARLFPGLMKKMLIKALDQGVAALKQEAESRFGRSGV